MPNFAAGALSLCFGAFGDIASRIIWYNCSIDKIWTLFFMLPPISIVTMILYFTDMIKEAPLPCESIFDMFFVLIPVVIGILSFVLPQIMRENTMGDTAIAMILYIILFAFARIYKYYKSCSTKYPNADKPVGKIIVNGLLRSLTTNLGIMAFNWLADQFIVQMIPVIGISFTMWSYVGNYSPALQHGIPLTFAHFILNMTENSDSFINSVCT